MPLSDFAARVTLPSFQAAPSLFSLASQSKFPAVMGTRPAQRTTIDLLVQLFPELPQHRLQMIAQTYGENKIMAIENALALRRAQVRLCEPPSLCAYIMRINCYKMWHFLSSLSNSFSPV